MGLALCAQGGAPLLAQTDRKTRGKADEEKIAFKPTRICYMGGTQIASNLLVIGLDMLLNVKCLYKSEA